MQSKEAIELRIRVLDEDIRQQENYYQSPNVSIEMKQITAQCLNESRIMRDLLKWVLIEEK